MRKPRPLVILLGLFLVNSNPVSPIFFGVVLSPVRLLRFFRALLASTMLVTTRSGVPSGMFQD